MKKENKEILMDALYKLCDNAFKSIQNITDNSINFYQSYYEILKLDLKYLKENEPMKLFKKTHKKWEEDVIKKENEIIDILKKINECVKSMNIK